MNIKEAIDKNNSRWNEIIKEKYLSRTDYNFGIKIVESRRKKEIKILTKAIFDLNKTISKLKKQEDFLNELLDEKIEEISKLKKIKAKKGDIKNFFFEWDKAITETQLK